MATIPITERKYTLVEKIDETPEVLILKFMPEDNQPTPFDPGMFMMIVGVDSSGNRYTGRAFSIASDPSVPGMDFMVIKEPTHGDHMGRSHFVDAKIGDLFFMKGHQRPVQVRPGCGQKGDLPCRRNGPCAVRLNAAAHKVLRLPMRYDTALQHEIPNRDNTQGRVEQLRCRPAYKTRNNGHKAAAWRRLSRTDRPHSCRHHQELRARLC